MTGSDTGLEERLAALRATFAAALPDRVRQLSSAWRPLRDGRWDAEGYRTAMRQAHSLAGAGATFGHAQISESARCIERALQQALDEARALAPPECCAVDVELDKLTRKATGSSGADGPVDSSSGLHSE